MLARLADKVDQHMAGHPDTGRNLLFLKDLWKDVEGLLAQVVGDIGDLFDDDDFDAKLKSMKEILKPQRPFEARNFTEGTFTGLLSIFVPKLETSESGMESITTLQQCFDPRQLHAEFFSQEAIKLRTDWDVKTLTDGEQKALKDLSDQVSEKTSLRQLKDKLGNSGDALQALRKFVKVCMYVLSSFSCFFIVSSFCLFLFLLVFKGIEKTVAIVVGSVSSFCCLWSWRDSDRIRHVIHHLSLSSFDVDHRTCWCGYFGSNLVEGVERNH